MEPATMLCPSGTAQLLLPSLKSSCPKLSFVNMDSIKHRSDLLVTRDLFWQLDRLFLSTAVSLRRHSARFFWPVFIATSHREISVEEPIAETRLENEFPQQTPVFKENCNENETSVSNMLEESRTVQQSNISIRRNDKVINISSDALIPGAIFTGKVTNVQKFGAFVDIGAFTSGLIHISNLSRSYVEAVEDIVHVGQEVRVEILSVNPELKRISLRLKNGELKQEEEEFNQHGGMAGGGSRKLEGRELRFPQRGSQERRNSPVKKPQKGAMLIGIVKNIVKSGAFVTLNQGFEGFLPASEVDSSGVAVVPEEYFRLGQEVAVRVLRTVKDRIVLTTKKKEINNEFLKKELEIRATNPFEIAFRRNPIIASYLEQKQKLEDTSESEI